MKFKELQKKEEKDLQEILLKNREKLRELRFKVSHGQLKNVREIREIRKDISNILTALNKKKEIKNSK
ncbi:50S ribosomal protein L29 [bacterium]|nr:50S ribosomal protein L29 [bacterium]